MAIEVNESKVPEEHEGHMVVDTYFFGKAFCEDCSKWVQLKNVNGGARPIHD